MNMKDVMTGKATEPEMEEGEDDETGDVMGEIGGRIARALGVDSSKVDSAALAEAIGDLIDSR